MNEPDGSPGPTTDWETFVLASCARLGHPLSGTREPWMAPFARPLLRFGTGLLGFTSLWLWEWAAQPS